MARTTVVGYDGSEAATAALRYAARREADGGRLVVAHSANVPSEFLETPYYEKSLERARERAGTILDEVDSELPGGATVETAVLSGPPAQALVKLAYEVDAAEIAVGSRGFGPWRAAALGSTSHALLHESDRPVLVIPRRAVEPEARRAGTEQGEERLVIVVGYDGSDFARRALDYAAERARPDGRLVAVYAYDAPSGWLGAPFYGQALAEHQLRGRELLTKLEEHAPPGAQLETDLLEGPPAEALVRAAHAFGASEIVLGARGLGRFRAALGSVSHALLHEADLPVVVVPGAPRD